MNIKTIMMTSGIWYLACILAFAEDAPLPPQAPPTQQLEGFNLNGYTTGGKKSWEINGDKADISDEKIKITNVDANAFDKQKVNLKSRTGTINKISGDINLKDNVVITAERGTQMTTDTLDWKRNQDLITTKDPVKIVDKQGVITGKGLTAHPNLKQGSINQDVKAVLNTTKDLVPNQTATITCDGPMQMDQLKMVAVFNINVVAVEASTGRQLRADKMTVYFDDKNKKIRKVICKGHVSFIQGVNASYADEMVYDGDDQQLIMTGRPKLVFDTSDNKGSGLFPKMEK